jgi:hypothetical protein
MSIGLWSYQLGALKGVGCGGLINSLMKNHFQADQFSHWFNKEFLHNENTVALRRFFGVAQFVRNLLVQYTDDDVKKR